MCIIYIFEILYDVKYRSTKVPPQSKILIFIFMHTFYSNRDFRHKRSRSRNCTRDNRHHCSCLPTRHRLRKRRSSHSRLSSRKLFLMVICSAGVSTPSGHYRPTYYDQTRRPDWGNPGSRTRHIVHHRSIFQEIRL